MAQVEVKLLFGNPTEAIEMLGALIGLNITLTPAPPQVAPSEDTPAPPAVTDAPLSMQDVESALEALVAAKGIPAARALLVEFGVARTRELKPEQFAAFLAKAGAA